MLDEAVVAAPMDIDLCLILGAGWPFHLGGITPVSGSGGDLRAGDRPRLPAARSCLRPRLTSGLLFERLLRPHDRLDGVTGDVLWG